jgi:hypothetical protein
MISKRTRSVKTKLSSGQTKTLTVLRPKPDNEQSRKGRSMKKRKRSRKRSKLCPRKMLKNLSTRLSKVQKNSSKRTHRRRRLTTKMSCWSSKSKRKLWKTGIASRSTPSSCKSRRKTQSHSR